VCNNKRMKQIILNTIFLLITTQTHNASIASGTPKRTTRVERIQMILKQHTNVKDTLSVAKKIHSLSVQYNLNAQKVLAVMLHESNGDTKAIGPTGDYGLMQINKIHKLPNTEMLNPVSNVAYGIKLLATSERICAYNLGNAGYKRNPRTCAKYEKSINIKMKQLQKYF